jgi:phospholipase C
MLLWCAYWPVVGTSATMLIPFGTITLLSSHFTAAVYYKVVTDNNSWKVYTNMEYTIFQTRFVCDQPYLAFLQIYYCSQKSIFQQRDNSEKPTQLAGEETRLRRTSRGYERNSIQGLNAATKPCTSTIPHPLSSQYFHPFVNFSLPHTVIQRRSVMLTVLARLTLWKTKNKKSSVLLS